MRPELVRATIAGRKTVTRRLGKGWADRMPGDVLWVRETWADLYGMGFDRRLAYRADSLRPDGSDEDGDSKRCRLDFGVKWKASIFMPKSACRLWLEVVSVRLERLQDITEEDAKSEGVQSEFEVDVATFVLRQKDWKPDSSYRLGFKHAWNRINPKQPWMSNPKVYRIEFKVRERR